MRYSQKLALEADIARRLAEAQAILDAHEKAASETAKSSPVPNPTPPTEGRLSGRTPQPLAPSSNSDSVVELKGKLPAQRGRWPGGRRRFCAAWFKPLARIMATGKSFQKAASILGLKLSRAEENRIRQLKEFRKLRFSYLRIYESSVWGRGLEEDAALEKLLVLEEGRPHRTPPKPKGAKYISWPLRGVPCPKG